MGNGRFKMAKNRCRALRARQMINRPVGVITQRELLEFNDNRHRLCGTRGRQCRCEIVEQTLE